MAGAGEAIVASLFQWRAGLGCEPQGVAVLLKIYAHCIDGQADAATRRITGALGTQDTRPEPELGDEGDDRGPECACEFWRDAELPQVGEPAGDQGSEVGQGTAGGQLTESGSLIHQERR